MKTYRTLKLSRGFITAVGGFTLFTGALQGAPFLYSPGDLVLAIRQTGGAYDYAVNIGKATNFNALPPGTNIVISNLVVSQLASAFPSVNDLKWSVAAANRPPADANYPLQTLWVTAPRADANTQSVPWLRKGQYTQGNAGAQIDGVGNNAAQASSNLPGGGNNTATGVVIPANNLYAFDPVIGPDGNYAGSFQGNVEAITASDFDSDLGNVSRSDLYELIPGTSAGGTLNTAGRYLGYFELKPDGTLTFNTSAPLPPRPTITNITRSGNVTTVSFATVSSATYRLRAANAGLTSPVSSWSIGASITGNGSVLSLSDTNSADIRFFAVDAQ